MPMTLRASSRTGRAYTVSASSSPERTRSRVSPAVASARRFSDSGDMRRPTEPFG